jgi:HEPN domain-containing protein
MTPLGQEWVEKAERDRRTVEWLLREAQPDTDAVCFHAQQCAEKYLKAWLQERGTVFPKTHDLEVLLDLLIRVDASWTAYRADASRLTPFAVQYRYPGVSASRGDAQDAMAACDRIRQAMRAFLSLPP